MSTTIKGINRVCLLYSNLGAPTRYRVWQQIEQMQLLGLDVIPRSDQEKWPTQLLADCDLLYIYRLPWSSALKRIVGLAKQRRLPVIFDIDDYMWDPDLQHDCFLDRYYSASSIIDKLDERDQLQIMMSQVDAFILSTPFLAHLAQTHFAKPAFVNANAVSLELLELSEAAYRQRQPNNYDQVVLGYFSGHAYVHELDFQLIRAPLLAILKAYPQVRLKIVGHLNLDQDWLDESLKSRVQHYPPVDWKKLPSEIARVDINLAPLITNPFTRSKSAVKFLETALLGVPTVASTLEPYQDIEHGVTGMLAATADEWFQSLAALIESPTERLKIGKAARNYVISQHTTAIRAANLGQILTSIVTHDFNGNSIKPQLLLKNSKQNHPFKEQVRRALRTAYHSAIPLKTRLFFRDLRTKRGG